MSYTYSGSPSSSPVDAVHYLLGDTNPSDVLATDEECIFELRANRGNAMLAAACIAETKAAQLVMRPTMVKRGDRTTMYGDGAQAYLMLARSLRQRASIATTGLYAGGIDVGEKEADRRDQSTVQPFVTKHLHEQFPAHHRREPDAFDPRSDF